jgi:hypothetical protein
MSKKTANILNEKYIQVIKAQKDEYVNVGGGMGGEGPNISDNRTVISGAFIEL